MLCDIHRALDLIRLLVFIFKKIILQEKFLSFHFQFKQMFGIKTLLPFLKTRPVSFFSINKDILIF